MLSNLEKWKGDELDLTSDTIALEGEYRILIYQTGEFKTFVNFELTTEIYTRAGANAAILFHTSKRNSEQGYEVRIDNCNPGNWDRLLITGSLTSIRNIHYKMVEDESGLL